MCLLVQSVSVDFPAGTQAPQGEGPSMWTSLHYRSLPGVRFPALCFIFFPVLPDYVEIFLAGLLV